MYQIVKYEHLGGSTALLEIEAKQLAKKAEAGQFLIIRIAEDGERIPLTIADYDREAGTVTIVYQVIGRTTKELSKLRVGDEILDVVGPLGHATEVENFGTVVLVGGGVGIAPIYPIARALKAAGNHVISIIGAKNKDLLFWEDKMAKASHEVLVATDDGSAGTKGFVSDVLKDLLAEREIDRVWAIGPMVMMRAVCETTRPTGHKTIVSMNPMMIDGTGMCGGCRISVGTETKFACVDGPEFDGHLVDFNLAMRRLAYFKDMERKGLEHYDMTAGGAQ